MTNSFISVLCAFSLLTPTITSAFEKDSSSWLSRRLQSSNARVVAEAFECDEYQQKLPQEELDAYKPLGYEIRVCIQPVTPTRNRGIVMRSIDDFTWYKAQGSTVQPAVVKNIDQSLTLAVCIPGRVVCTLKTKLLDDFFYNPKNGTVVGTGTVSMQVQGDEDNPTIRRKLGADENGIFQAVVEWTGGSRGLQVGSAFGGYAGSSGVSMRFNVDQLEPPADFVPYVPDDVSSWWEDSPTWLKVLVIAGAIILLLMACCLCLMCFWAFREQMEDERNKGKEVKNAQAEEQAPGFGAAAPEYHNAAWENYEPNAAQDDDAGAAGGSAQPTDKDVCFDADLHPGTKAMYAAVQKTLKKYPKAEYSPVQYRHIKKQLPGRRFFVSEDGEWREVDNTELVDLLKVVFDQKQYEQQNTSTLVTTY